MKILITGFDPFGGQSINPALEAVKALPDQIGSVDLIKLEIPTVFHTSIDILAAAMEQHQPDAVLCVGQAGGRDAITMERVAINISDAGIPDNAGYQPIDEPIRVDGAPAYFSNLPVKAMVAHIRQAGINARLSNTAGTFVCNHLMYGLLYLIEQQSPLVKGGFVHVPFLPSQVSNPNTPSMELSEIVKGLTCCIHAIAENMEDIKSVEGALH